MCLLDSCDDPGRAIVETSCLSLTSFDCKLARIDEFHFLSGYLTPIFLLLVVNDNQIVRNMSPLGGRESSYNLRCKSAITWFPCYKFEALRTSGLRTIWLPLTMGEKKWCWNSGQIKIMQNSSLALLPPKLEPKKKDLFTLLIFFLLFL